MTETESEFKYTPGESVKRLDLSKGYFTANGKTYFIQPTMAVGRYKVYEPLTMQTTFGTDLSGIIDVLTKSINALSGNDGYGMNLLKAQTDTLNQLSNLRANALNFFEQSNQHPVLLLCTLVCNTSGEDERKWSPAMANEKINDWQEEGIAMEDFFLLALNLIPGLKKAFQEPWAKALIGDEEN